MLSKKRALQFFLLVLSLYFVPSSFGGDIRDVKGPVDFPASHFFLYMILALIVLGACFGITRFLMKRFKDGKRKTLILKSPWEIAFERLEQLKQQNLPALKLIKAYYSGLSDILRKYIEDRFSIRAPEMTTQEFLLYLKDSPELNSGQKDILKEFLNHCDLVKFAKYGPSPNEINESFDVVRRFVAQTKEPDSIMDAKK